MTVNPLFGTAALWPLEFGINQLIQSDQHLQACLLKFDQSLLEINSTAPDACFCVTFSGSKIRLSALSSREMQVPATATITAKASVLFDLLLSAPSANALANPDLTIEGDGSFVHELFTAMTSLDLRWDDLLAPWLGDISTHAAKNASDDFKRWRTDTAGSINSSMNDYLTEESALLPSSNSVEQFTARLDQLKLRVDRARARVDLLQEPLKD